MHAAGFVTAVATPEQFDAVLVCAEAAGALVVATFSSQWCRKCKFMQPRLRKLAAAAPDTVFVTVDCNKVARLPREYGVESMPTFVFLEGTRRIGSMVGGAEAGALVASIRDVMTDHAAKVNTTAKTTTDDVSPSNSA
jgi:thioredoxin 1